ncbi:hypothetical protein [Paraburkholderia azotifigens]|uniref:Quercetin 2,3-dioxygenase C-terminal cupin domain-containing protein n=1 Tax=Paraburkholderia azotifigens TaxID=2057004 RepID=A0ABU9R7Y3_9BURK|nr:hypothetical protein [Paraburkholderia azotifigens]
MPGGTPRWATRVCSPQLRCHARERRCGRRGRGRASHQYRRTRAYSDATRRHERAARVPEPGSAYLVADNGRIEVGHVCLARRDGVAVPDEAQVTLTARDDTDVVLAELLRQDD